MRQPFTAAVSANIAQMADALRVLVTPSALRTPSEAVAWLCHGHVAVGDM